MKRVLTIAGLLLLFPLSTLAAEKNLYNLFRTQVQEEFSTPNMDKTVLKYLQGVYRERWDLNDEQMKAAVLNDASGACGTGESDSQERTLGGCSEALENIGALAKEEQALRTFGRNLQRIATAQELPISEIPGRPFHLATDLSGIINIWRAGTGSIQQAATGAILIRTKALSDDEADSLRPKFEELAIALEDGNEEWRTGFVWYFQYGARLRAGDRNPTYPPPFEDGHSEPGTERQYLFYEQYTFPHGGALKDIWNVLPKDRNDFDPPLSNNEVAYVLFPDELQDILPENVLLWARIDKAPDSGSSPDQHPLGDVGLAWRYPMEPLLPALLSVKTDETDKPILGGRYPPEPATDDSSDEEGNPLPSGTKRLIDGRGLCSMALAQRGYLCRAFHATSEEQCPEPASANNGENVITLVSCTLDDAPTFTIAGADVCREIDWKNENPNAPITRCDVNIRCADDCGLGGGEIANTSPKRPNGSIDICISNGAGIGITNYLVLHELVHAYQNCGLPAKDSVYAGLTFDQAAAQCCRFEGEAYRAACKAMEDDGVFQRDTDGDGVKEPVVIDGITIDSQVCGEFGADFGCRAVQFDGKNFPGCPVSRSYPAGFFAKLVSVTDVNPAGVPASCAEATDEKKMDPRLAARLRTIERHTPLCMPGTLTEYKNTIGNNACYIGQCVEDSLELHRLTGGRSPATVGDSAFPYDNPATGEALAKIVRSVPATHPPLPSYRPLMVLRTLEDALCQLQGLPAATPPHLCAFAPTRRLATPLEDAATTGLSLIDSAQEQRDATLLTEELAAGLGSRIGTDMQGQYLRIGTRTLSEVVGLANMLLHEAITVKFPTNMCPLNLVN